MKVKFPILFAAVISMTLLSCKKDNGADAESSVTPVTTNFNVNATLMLQLVNQVRQSGCNCGTTAMPPVAIVSWNDLLAKAAYDHSVDMESKNYFDHTGVNGSTPGTRITAAGYTWRTYGENIAKGYTSESAVVNGWLASEGHCKNIMNAGFREMGVGRSGAYWTQEFGSR